MGLVSVNNSQFNFMRNSQFITWIVLFFAGWFSQSAIADLSTVSRRTPVVEVVELASPAVVNINTEQTVLTRQYPFGQQQGPQSIEEFFFGPQLRGNPTYIKENVPLSIGSGVIIDPQGYLLTNHHVLKKASAIKVTLKDGKSFKAKVVGAEPQADLAVLKIEAPVGTKFNFVKPGDSGDVMIGETVVAIGNPFGLSHTVSTGVISALKRQVKAEGLSFDDYIQTDTAINPGNSGGPLLNIKGELIGINSAVLRGGGNGELQAEGIGFAIPINFAKRVMDDLIQYGRLIPAYVGFRVWKSHGKVWVVDVDGVGPAALVGLKSGDELVRCNGAAIKSESDFHSQVIKLTPGENFSCELLRFNNLHKESKSPVANKIAVTIQSQNFRDNFWQLVAKQNLGVELKELRGALLIGGVIAGSAAAKIGLRPGDKLLQIDSTSLESLNDFIKIAPNIYYRSSLVLVIERNSSLYYATLTFEPT
jgi:serine protease Do